MSDLVLQKVTYTFDSKQFEPQSIIFSSPGTSITTHMRASYKHDYLLNIPVQLWVYGVCSQFSRAFWVPQHSTFWQILHHPSSSEDHQVCWRIQTIHYWPVGTNTRVKALDCLGILKFEQDHTNIKLLCRLHWTGQLFHLQICLYPLHTNSC